MWWIAAVLDSGAIAVFSNGLRCSQLSLNVTEAHLFLLGPLRATLNDCITQLVFDSDICIY